MEKKKKLWSRFCGFLLKVMGWKVDGGPVPESKAILLGAPHTSIWDVVVSYLFYQQFDTVTPKCLIKKEMFVWPLRKIMYAVGGIPVDRKNAASLVHSVIEQANRSDDFILAMAPEGTRKPVKRWKTGFHTIAKHANIPVYIAYFDWGTKHVGIDSKVELTEDPAADLLKIQQRYEELKVKGKHPEKFLTR